MRFIVDECTGPAVARWLESQGHEVYSIYDNARGSEDSQILGKANSENWILITNDKDFGEKIYREKHHHRGVILLRLNDERKHNKIRVLRQIFGKYADKIVNHFVVATETTVRFGSP